MALAGALCVAINGVMGITNRSLRAQVTSLLGSPYSPAQMTYDLRRLRLKGLIRRLERSHRYVLTSNGIRMAIFYTKVYGRVLRPLLSADQPSVPAELRAALRVIDHHVSSSIAQARLRPAA